MILLELIFIIISTIILSAIYTTIVLLILLAIIKLNDTCWIKNLLASNWKFWIKTHFLISVLLFFLRILIFNETGFGDNARIPIGFGHSIQSEDFQWTYFFPDLHKTEPNKDELIISNYAISKNKICAEVSHQYSQTSSYNFIVFDLPTQTLTTFDKENDYTIYANNHSLPLRIDFYSFQKHYNEYLEKRPFWRVWLMP